MVMDIWCRYSKARCILGCSGADSSWWRSKDCIWTAAEGEAWLWHHSYVLSLSCLLWPTRPKSR